MKTTKEILRHIDAKIHDYEAMRDDRDFKNDKEIKDFFQEAIYQLLEIKDFILEN